MSAVEVLSDLRDGADLAARLRDLREQAGLSQVALSELLPAPEGGRGRKGATLLHRSQSWVTKVEKGKIQPDFAVVLQWIETCQALPTDGRRGPRPPRAESVAHPVLEGMPSLRDLRLAAGMTQGQVAEFMGYSEGAWRHVESGRNGISAVEWVRLLAHFGWTVTVVPPPGWVSRFEQRYPASSDR